MIHQCPIEPKYVFDNVCGVKSCMYRTDQLPTGCIAKARKESDQGAISLAEIAWLKQVREIDTELAAVQQRAVILLTLREYLQYVRNLPSDGELPVPQVWPYSVALLDVVPEDMPKLTDQKNWQAFRRHHTYANTKHLSLDQVCPQGESQ